MVSNEGLSSGASAQHLAASSSSSTAAPPADPTSPSPTTGRKGGDSRAHTRDTISIMKLNWFQIMNHNCHICVGHRRCIMIEMLMYEYLYLNDVRVPYWSSWVYNDGKVYVNLYWSSQVYNIMIERLTMHTLIGHRRCTYYDEKAYVGLRSIFYWSLQVSNDRKA